MRANAILTSLVFVGIALIAGCSSDPKDPFKEWGAASKYSEYVPESARSVASGVGTLKYTVPSEGTLYLIDTNAMVNIKGVQKPKVLIAGGPPAGSEVVFTPEDRRIRVTGHEGVRLKEVDPTHTHEFRFDAGK